MSSEVRRLFLDLDPYGGWSMNLNPLAFRVFILPRFKALLDGSCGEAKEGSNHQKESVERWVSFETELFFLFLFVIFFTQSSVNL